MFFTLIDVYHGAPAFQMLYAQAFLLGAITFGSTAFVQVAASLLNHVAHLPDLYEASILELRNGLDAQHFTSFDLVKVCIMVIIFPRHFS